MTKPVQRDNRPGLLARVHILAKELGLDDDAYRQALHDAFGVRSCRYLNTDAMRAFADALVRMLPEKHPQRRGYPGQPHTLRKPAEGEPESSANAQLRKVEALLSEAGYPWRYADTLARRICKVERIAWVPEHDLYKIITALEKDATRHERYRG